MLVFQWCLIGLAIYVGVFAIVDRICKCCEQCATNRSLGEAYGKFLEAQKEKEKP